MEIAEKKELINRIEEIDNSLLISRINHIVGQIETEQNHSTDKLEQFSALIDEISDDSSDVNEPIQTNLQLAIENYKLQRFENNTAGFMFFWSLLALLLSGLLIMYGSEEATFRPENRIATKVLWVALGIWPIFLMEFLNKLRLANKAEVSRYLLIIHSLTLLFPPARLVIGSMLNPKLIWLPVLGWSKINPALERHLKKKFLVPILVLGLLMIPALLIEIKFKTQLTEIFPHLDLAFWLQTFHAIVWAGFAIEFMVLISITDDKKNYCVKNWMDILILLLPVVSFFRSFRFLRVLKFNQLAHSFRMKGTQAKVREGLVLLDFLKRLSYLYNPEGQIKKLKKKMVKNEQERRELEKEMLEAIHILIEKRKNKAS